MLRAAFSNADIKTCSTNTLSPVYDGASCTTFVNESSKEDISSTEPESFFELKISARTLKEDIAS